MIDAEINKNRVYIDTNGDMIYIPSLCNTHENKFLKDKHEKYNYGDRKIYVKFHKMYFDD